VTSIPHLALGILGLLGLSGSLAYLTMQGDADRALAILLGGLVAAIFFLRPALGIVAFLASFLTTYRTVFASEGYFTPNNLLGLFLTLLLLLKLHHDKDFWFLKDRIVLVYAVLIAWILIGSRVVEIGVHNPVPDLDTTGSMRHMLLSRFIFLLLFINFVRTVRDLKLVLFATVTLILLTALAGLQSSLEAVDRPGLRAAAQSGIQAAGNPNRLAFFSVAAMAIIWYYRRAVRRSVVAGALTLLIPGLALTALLAGSRSGLLNLLLFFFLVSVEGRFSIKRQVQTVVVAGAVLVLATSLLTTFHSERLANILPGSGAAGAHSTDKRMDTVRDGLGMLMENPILGVGIGNFMWKHLEYSAGATYGPPHNSYLWAAVEGGLPALLLYLVLFSLAFKRLLSVERGAADLQLRMIASGLRTTLLAFLFFSIFADFWVHIFTYLIVALAITLKRIQDREGAPAAAPARLAAPAGAAAGAAPA
jgi:O-antigen ligase